jgi:hypothetical protein
MHRISLVQPSEACWWALIMDQVRNDAVMDKCGGLAEFCSVWHK